MRRPPASLAIALVPLAALLAARSQEEPPLARLAGAADAAELAFEVRERGGGLVAARLTFVPAEGAARALFPHTDAAPDELAVRDNVVYSKSGAGRITVPPGRYTVHASRGPEWSLASQELELAPGAPTRMRAELVRELDTSGWIAADFHLHTLTHSGHGDAGLEERLLTFLGEGLEFVVATDHDHHTDYGPIARALGVEGAFTAVTGNEVSTPIGHFNAFPLDPARAPVDAARSDANVIFRELRAQTNAHGVVPVIQLNHPRLANIDYFTRTGLDPVTGASADPRYSRDFDSIEVLNENRALGYHDPVADRRDTHGHRHSARVDWFHLLNRGERYAAVGNSDSHHVLDVVAGYPRNYVRSSTDDPARIRPAEVAAAVRAKQLFTTTGPFLELSVAGAPMGGEARADGGHAPLSLRVRAASWVDCDRAEVFVDGELVATVPIADSRAPLRLEHELELCFLGSCARHGKPGAPPRGASDGWVVVVVEGDDPLVPVLGPETRPLAIANPVWVDGDGDGRWTSPLERVELALRAQATPDLARAWFATLAPVEQELALALVARGPFAAVLVEAGFVSQARGVRLAAARAAEHHVLAGSMSGVQRAWSENSDDPFLGALLVRVFAAARPEQAAASIAGFAERFGQAALRDYAAEIVPLFPAGGGSSWQVLGPMPSDSPLRARDEPPPAVFAPDVLVQHGDTRDWSDFGEPELGYVDLRTLGGKATEHKVVYAQTFLHTDAPRSVPCAFGSDDGSRVWLADRLIYENRATKSANPLETLLTLELAAGWNRVVLEIENATGGFGFYFRPLEPGVVGTGSPR